MRVYYGRRGGVRGYSTGLWGLLLLLLVQLLLLLAVVLPILAVLLAALLVCKLGAGIMAGLGKAGAAARWRQWEVSVLRAVASFMRWTERMLGRS